MPIHLVALPSTAPGEATATYHRTDFTLLVAPAGSIPAGMKRASIGSLTLYFDHNGTFIGFDGYTNIDNWSRRPVTPPTPELSCAMSLTDPVDVHGIAVGSDDDMAYTYSQAEGTLLIEIRQSAMAKAIRCLDTVTCVLDNDDQLLQIWVERLHVE